MNLLPTELGGAGQRGSFRAPCAGMCRFYANQQIVRVFDDSWGRTRRGTSAEKSGEKDDRDNVHGADLFSCEREAV